jgi:hypothetical protein
MNTQCGLPAEAQIVINHAPRDWNVPASAGSLSDPQGAKTERTASVEGEDRAPKKNNHTTRFTTGKP